MFTRTGGRVGAPSSYNTDFPVKPSLTRILPPPPDSRTSVSTPAPGRSRRSSRGGKRGRAAAADLDEQKTPEDKKEGAPDKAVLGGVTPRAPAKGRGGGGGGGKRQATDVGSSTGHKLGAALTQAAAPEARWGCTVNVLANGNIMVYGGEGDAGATLGDLRLFDLETLEWQSPVNTDSLPRAWHTATHLPNKDLVVVFGGEVRRGRRGRRGRRRRRRRRERGWKTRLYVWVEVWVFCWQVWVILWALC